MQNPDGQEVWRKDYVFGTEQFATSVYGRQVRLSRSCYAHCLMCLRVSAVYACSPAYIRISCQEEALQALAKFKLTGLSSDPYDEQKYLNPTPIP